MDHPNSIECKSHSKNTNSTKRPTDYTVFILDSEGIIHDCNESINQLFSLSRRQAHKKHISQLIPDLSNYTLYFNGEINPRANLLCRIGWPFRAKTGTDAEFYCLLFLTKAQYKGKIYLRLIARNITFESV